MKVVLINPAVAAASTFPSGEFFSCTAPNMGLAYIAAVLEQANFEVTIIDANALFLDDAQLEEAIRLEAPDAIGVTATTTTLLDGYRAANAARKAAPSALVAMGGIHATRFPEETLEECAALDVVIRGEGEITWVELLKSLEEGCLNMEDIAGIAYRRDNSIVLNEEREPLKDLDALPLPARHLLPLDKYQAGGHPHRTASIVSSRGCPFGCKFCAAPFIGGKRYRARSAQSLLAEVDEIVNVYKMSSFEFVDDLFTLDSQRVMDFCAGIKERGYDVTWTCSARADTVSPELLRAMAQAGCRIIYYGVESGSQRILDLVGKRETLQQMRQAIEWTRQASMRSWGFFIIGFPDEMREEVRATIDFACSSGLDYAEFFICSAFPGSPLYDYALEHGLIQKKTWADISYGKANILNEHMTPQELELLMMQGYRDFYTSPHIAERLRAYGQPDLVEEIRRQTDEAFSSERAIRAQISIMLKDYESDRRFALPALRSIQDAFGYIPPEAFDLVGERFSMIDIEVEGLATFYGSFRLSKPGKHSICLCRGTACHLKGSALVSQEFQKVLRLEPGQTSKDGLFDLQEVACMGCCNQAPVVSIDGNVYGSVKPSDVKSIVDGVIKADDRGFETKEDVALNG